MELCKEYKSMNCNERKECLCEGFDIDYQLNLPQYLDDIEKLIKCDVKNIVSDYELSSSSIKMYGKSVIIITYLNSNSCPVSNIFEEEFSKTISINENSDYRFAQVSLQNKYYNFRLVNQRRIDLHISLNACVEVYCDSLTDGLISCKNAFLRQEDITVLKDKYSGVASVEFDETISVADRKSNIKNIVNTSYCSYVDESKIIKDKMLVKINADVNVVYVDDNDELQKASYSFSVSKIIDVLDCDENDNSLIFAEISQLYVKPKADKDNNLCDVELVGRICVNYRIKTSDEMSYIKDAYIPYNASQLQFKKMLIKKNPLYYFDDKTIEMIFENEKSIVEIVDIKADVNSCKIDDSVLSFSVVLSFIYYDDSSQLCYFRKSADYSFSLNDSKLSGEACVNLKSFDFVIKSTDKISLRLNIEYCAYLYSTEMISYVSDLEVGEECDKVNLPELTLYFANKNECVWDIAKAFSTDSRLIMEENDLKSDIVDASRILLVPGM